VVSKDWFGVGDVVANNAARGIGKRAYRHHGEYGKGAHCSGQNWHNDQESASKNGSQRRTRSD